MARDTLPGADERERADERDGEMEVIRERLDGAPLPGWRGAAAGGLERIGVWFGADASQAPSSAQRPTWERRLTARQKLARGAITVFAIALALFALLDGPDATRGALSALDATLHPPRPIPSIAAAGYALQRLPPSAQHLARIALAPSQSRPSAAYACWVNPFRSAPDGQRGIAVVYRTTDLATTWMQLYIPQMEAMDCDVAADASGGDGALVVVWPSYTTGGFCQTPRLFHSVDGGATWDAVPWAEPGVLSPCDARFALDGDAIFAWSTLSLISSPQSIGATGRLIVTRDDGATWAAADAGLTDDDSGLALVGFRAGGRILATTPDVRGPPGAARLMETTDYGASWRDLGDLPGAFPTVYVSTDPNVPGDWGRLYEIARPLSGGVPADASHVMLETAASPGSSWSRIPLPPLASSDSVSSGLPIVVGVGPAGSLLVERGVVLEAHDAELSAARRLWAWSASQSRWLPDPQPSLGNADLLGWSWSHGEQTIWVTSLQLGVPPTLRLFTKTYTPAGLAPAS